MDATIADDIILSELSGNENALPHRFPASDMVVPAALGRRIRDPRFNLQSVILAAQ
jgi:hypothetical protein